MAQEHDSWKRPWWLAFLDKVCSNFCAGGNILIPFNRFFLAFETNLTVASLTACYLAYTRSAGVAYFGAGATMCSLTVKILKRILRQPRPVHKNGSHRKLTYGMPSTHSASITYYATYVPLACLYLPIHPSLPSSMLTRVVPSLVVVPWSILIRVWLGHHTWPQVAVGCSYGLVFACVWFTAWTCGFVEYGRILEQSLHTYVGLR
ncbi:hypothetical protein PILCRDRAFT_62374 [Piloderma croceum F 1598]|uniref:Phosphatidic acid phosphatase type 2/haloperoxidase domain-containing protein n=1 Tax=Piloderma croceum (strain F 1598) TaxID=765440 RepID=A0A0C3GD92_PILCF|nr:hypothetical protein PILCRDRAFT_62374 [Piloderma croceum F 1598]